MNFANRPRRSGIRCAAASSSEGESLSGDGGRSSGTTSPPSERGSINSRNLLPIGRSGMFKYNNQDHAMATGLLAARTALGVAKFDPWGVNIDAEYAEDGSAKQVRSGRRARTR